MEGGSFLGVSRGCPPLKDIVDKLEVCSHILDYSVLNHSSKDVHKHFSCPCAMRHKLISFIPFICNLLKFISILSTGMEHQYVLCDRGERVTCRRNCYLRAGYYISYYYYSECLNDFSKSCVDLSAKIFVWNIRMIKNFRVSFRTESVLSSGIDVMLILGRSVREEEDEDGGCGDSKDNRQRH